MSVFGIFDAVCLSLFIRCLGFFVLLPFDSSSKSVISKLLLAAFSAMFFRLNYGLDSKVHSSLLSEFFIGVLLALPILLLLEVVSLIGELIDSARGQSLASFYDPTIGLPQSSLARLFRWGTWALVLNSGAVEVSLSHISRSFEITAGKVLSLSALAHLFQSSLIYSLEVLNVSFGYFLAFAILFLILDLSVGVFGLLMPQISLYTEAFQVKTYLAVAGLMLMVHIWPLNGFKIAAITNWPLDLVSTYIS